MKMQQSLAATPLNHKLGNSFQIRLVGFSISSLLYNTDINTDMDTDTNTDISTDTDIDTDTDFGTDITLIFIMTLLLIWTLMKWMKRQPNLHQS